MSYINIGLSTSGSGGGGSVSDPLNIGTVNAGTVNATQFSGSLTKLTDGTSFLVAGDNAVITTGSNGAVTINAINVVKLTGTVAAGSVVVPYVSGGSGDDPRAVSIATSANLASHPSALSVTLEAGTSGSLVKAAFYGDTVPSSIHGLSANGQFSWVVVNTSTGLLSKKDSLDGSEYVVGTLSANNVFTVQPERQFGYRSINILDPRYGLGSSLVLTSGALDRAIADAGPGGRIMFPKRRGDTTATVYTVDDETWISYLSASDHVSGSAVPAWGITFEGESVLGDESYGVQIRNQINDPQGTSGSIGAVTGSQQTFEFQIPVTDPGLRGEVPLLPKKWIDHYLNIERTTEEYHHGRFLVVGINNDGANGAPVRLNLAIRGGAPGVYVKGNDANNGNIAWRLYRWAFQTRARETTFKNLKFYGYQGYYNGGWHMCTEATDTRNTSVLTNLRWEDCSYDAYPASTYDSANSVSSYYYEMAEETFPAKYFQEAAQAYAWPISPRPGNYRYRSTTSGSIQIWAASTAYSASTVVKPSAAGTGFQWKCILAGTSSTSIPTTMNSFTTWGTVVTDGTAKFIAEFENEVGTGYTTWSSGESITSVGTVRVPSPRNGFKFVCTTTGSTGTTQPSGYGWSDRITDGTVRWTVYYDAGHGALFAPFNCDYFVNENVDSTFLRRFVWMDNNNGQSREHKWNNVNIVIGDWGMMTDLARYTNEYGTYGQLSWNRGSFGVSEGAIDVRSSAITFSMKDLLAESSARIGHIGSPAGGIVNIDDCRFTFPGSTGNGVYNGATFGKVHRSREMFVNGVETVNINNSLCTTFTNKHHIMSITGINANGGDGSAAQKISIKNSQVSAAARKGSFHRIISNRRGPFSGLSAGQNLIISYAVGTNDVYASSSFAFTASFVAGDFNADGVSQAWQAARAINRDCSKLWWPSQGYATASVVVPGTGFEYGVVTAGTSSTSEPTWPTTVGSTVSDGGITWKCNPLQTPGLHSWCDRHGYLYIDLLDGGPNTSAQLGSPRKYTGAIGSISIAGGTASASLGMPGGGGTAYTESEFAEKSLGIVVNTSVNGNGGITPEMTLIFDQVGVIGASAIPSCSLSFRFHQPVGGNQSIGDDRTRHEHQNRIITTPSYVPLRNPGGFFTFSDLQKSTTVIFPRNVEYDGLYYVKNISLASTSSAVASTGTVSTKTFPWGFAAATTTAPGSGSTATYSYDLARYDSGSAWTPNNIVGPATVNWYRNESLPTSGFTRWVNNGRGTNLLSALGAPANQLPTASLEANGRVSLQFNGINAFLTSSTLSTNYFEPIYMFMVLNQVTSSTTSYRYIVHGKNSNLRTPFLDYSGSFWQIGSNITSFAGLTIGVTSSGSPISENNGKGVLGICWSNEPRSSGRAWFVDQNMNNRTQTGQTFGAGLKVFCDGLTIMSRTDQLAAAFAAGKVYEIVHVNGQMTEEDIRRTELYLQSKFGFTDM